MENPYVTKDELRPLVVALLAELFTKLAVEYGFDEQHLTPDDILKSIYLMENNNA